MTDFLLELRSEEIPARKQAKAREDLAKLFTAELANQLHRPSFALGEVSDPLLVGVVLLGAMYSVNQDERRMAGSVMQYAEGYIFEHLPISRRHDHHEQDEVAFQSIQAALCMIVIQFWTGDAESKHRTMTSRFSQTIEVRSVIPLAMSTADVRTSAGLSPC